MCLSDIRQTYESRTPSSQADSTLVREYIQASARTAHPRVRQYCRQIICRHGARVHK
ncbi:hypothetical protein CENSYa_0067 [Cenarchaeum symbiosum A]|uniref:Uncharacterized protein n=1 Tax=Cenarchaeum symbiosum (strain A) TaxID=414004 RepID=A0RTP6_CENSY|nr:hypothetical protein CENSYa_0067 [Cenarchaeum symbiosum A]